MFTITMFLLSIGAFAVVANEIRMSYKEWGK